MKLVFLFLVLIYITHFGYGQLEIPFQVKTLDYTTQKKETGVTVKAFDAGILLSTVVSNSSGIAKVSLPAGKKYKLEISKPGKVARFVIVDLTKVTEEALDNGVDPTGGVDMSLFEEVKDVDYSYVAQNPATIFSFDPEEGMKFDVDIAKKTIKEVDKIIKNISGVKQEAQKQLLAKQESERLAKEQEAQKQLLAKQESERLAKEQEAQKQLVAKQESERLAKEQEAQKQLLAKQESDRLAKEQESQKQLLAKQESERLAKEQEAQKQLLAKQESERLAKEQEAQKQLTAKQESERLAKEQETQKQLLAKQESERLAKEQETQKQLLAKQESERLAKEQETQKQLLAKQESERLAKEQEAQKQLLAKQESERLAKEQEVQKQLLAKQESERLAKEQEAQKQLLAKQESERLAKEQESKKQLLAMQESERLAKEQESQKQLLAKQESESLAKEQESQKQLLAKQESERLAKEQEAQKLLLAKQESERIAKEQKAKEEEELAKIEQKKEEMKQLLSLAEQSYSSKRWLEAKKRYESLLKLNPELAFAQQRINQINAQLVIAAKEQSKPKVDKLEEISGDPTKESITENAALLDAANKKRMANKSKQVSSNSVKTQNKNDSLIAKNEKKMNKTTVQLDDVQKKIAEKQTLSTIQQKREIRPFNEGYVHDILNAIEQKGRNYNVQVGKDLATFYPDGVSQEEITVNDYLGLPQKTLLRRIVVIDAIASLYTRSTGNGMVTYLKNGFPTTEYVWQKETQDVSLTKNY